MHHMISGGGINRHGMGRRSAGLLIMPDKASKTRNVHWRIKLPHRYFYGCHRRVNRLILCAGIWAEIGLALLTADKRLLQD